MLVWRRVLLDFVKLRGVLIFGDSLGLWVEGLRVKGAEGSALVGFRGRV